MKRADFRLNWVTAAAVLLGQACTPPVSSLAATAGVQSSPAAQPSPSPAEPAHAHQPGATDERGISPGAHQQLANPPAPVGDVPQVQADGAGPGRPQSSDVPPGGAATSTDSNANTEGATPVDPSNPLASSAREVITGPRAVFLLDFANSDAKSIAESKCEDPENDDPAKLNECVAQIRAKIKSDGHRFTKDHDNKWWWVGYQRQGDTLLIQHKVQFEFGAETKNSITLKPKGPDLGRTPWPRVPRELMIEVPNSYSIVIRDAEFGKLKYNAKVGLTPD